MTSRQTTPEKPKYFDLDIVSAVISTHLLSPTGDVNVRRFARR